MVNRLLISAIASILLLISTGESVVAQKEIKQTRKGNREYREGGFGEAEILYRKAVDENPAYSNSSFNLGNALYRQEKFSDAAKSYVSLAEKEADRVKKAETLYNLGNTLLMENRLEESIEAYKQSLRLEPGNHEAKYNLAYAQDLLRREQEQQQQQDQNQDQQDQNQDQQDQQQQDQQQNQDQQDQQQQDQQQNQDQQDQQDQQQQDQPQNQDQQSISREDAERLLEALAQDEQEVQDRVKQAKAERRKVRTLKNW